MEIIGLKEREGETGDSSFVGGSPTPSLGPFVAFLVGRHRGLDL